MEFQEWKVVCISRKEVKFYAEAETVLFCANISVHYPQKLIHTHMYIFFTSVIPVVLKSDKLNKR
jgi:uncharacterized membrane protein